MAGIDDIDITKDLNGVPAQGDAVPVNQQPPPQDAPDGDKPEPRKSLRDTLSDAFRGEEAPKVEPAPEKPAEPVKPVDAPELVKVGDRFHRRDGSFASKEEIDAFTAGDKPQGEAPAAPALPPWADKLTDLEKQQFHALPAETRQFVERTMEGMNKRGEQYNEYALIDQVINPRKEGWANNGMTPLVAINNLLALSDFAGRDPGQFVLWFSDQHRLNLDQLLDARDAAKNGQPNNPQINGLQQEIAQLKNVINGFADTSAQQQQVNHMRTVQMFADEKDANGNIAHPYFGELADDIANHVMLIRQQQPYLPEHDILKAAYDFASFNNPVVRNALQQSRAQADKSKNAQEATRARQVGVSINGGPAGDTSKQPINANRTLRETLVHAFNQAQE
jgi:hypothetical protein